MTGLFVQYQGVETHSVVLEIIGVSFGFLSAWFAREGNMWVYPMDIISTVLFVYLFWHYILWDDMLISAYYTAASIYEWILWIKSAHNNIITISRTTSCDRYICAGLGLFSLTPVTIICYLRPFIQDNFSVEGVTLGFEHSLPTEYIDVFIIIIFLVGMRLMARRKIENWVFWIVGDLISVPLCLKKGMFFASLQYLLLTITAIMGYIEWKRHLRNTPAPSQKQLLWVLKAQAKLP